MRMVMAGATGANGKSWCRGWLPRVTRFMT
jgi:hypothetical protein